MARALIAAEVFVALANACCTAVAQVVTENAGTTSPETPLWQTRFEYLRASHATDVRAVESLTWAPTEKMDFALAVPLIRRGLELANGTDAVIEGLGDISLRGKWSLWKEDDVMKSTRFAGLAGISFPTGRWHEEENGVEIPRKLQLGTGAFGFFGGPLFTHINDRHRYAAELLGRYNLEHDNSQLQPSVQMGLAYWYRIAPARIEIAGKETEFRGVIELTNIFYGESKNNGHGEGDNGTIAWLSPGVQVYPSTSVLLEASLQLPIIETVHDVRGDRKFGALIAIKFLF